MSFVDGHRRSLIVGAVSLGLCGALIVGFRHSPAVGDPVASSMACPLSLAGNTNILPGTTDVYYSPSKREVLLYGRVTDREGEGVAGAFIRVFLPGSASIAAETSTQSDGCFVFPWTNTDVSVLQSQANVRMQFAAFGFAAQNQIVPQVPYGMNDAGGEQMGDAGLEMCYQPLQSAP